MAQELTPFVKPERRVLSVDVVGFQEAANAWFAEVLSDDGGIANIPIVCWANITFHFGPNSKETQCAGLISHGKLLIPAYEHPDFIRYTTDQ